jgi:hypothetical protein
MYASPCSSGSNSVTKPKQNTVVALGRIKLGLKGHSYKNVCEIIALNDRLDSN